MEPGDTCIHCHARLDESCQSTTRAAEFLTSNYLFKNVRVRIVTCSNGLCNKENYYDGCKDHIFNPDSKRLYCHSVLNSFTHHIWSVGRPSDRAFQDSVQFAYEENKSLSKFVNLVTFVKIWRSFIGKQLIRFANICTSCDRGLQINVNNPPKGEVNASVADGTCCGCKANQTNRIHNPKEVFDSSYVLDQICNKSDRFLTVAKKRKILARWFKKYLPDIQQDHVCLFL